MRAASQNSTRRQKHHKHSEAEPSEQKLRSSCDNCHAAKVKCTSTSSRSCARCLSHGMNCIYSPTLRVGKPNSSKRSYASSPLVRSRRPSASVDGESPSERSTPSQSRPAHTESINDVFSDDFGLGDSSMQGLDLNPFALNLMPTDLASISSPTALNTPNEYSASQWGEQHQAQLSSLSGRLQHEASFSWPMGDTNKPSEKPSPIFSTSQHQVLMGDANHEPTPIGNKPHFAAAEADAILERRAGNAIMPGDWDLLPPVEDACDCHTQLLQALRVPPRVIKAAHASRDTTAPVAAFDVLLAANKQSIQRCTTLLGCNDCFDGSRSFLSVFTLLSQILTLYSSACESYLVQPPPPAAAATSGNHGRQQPPPVVPGPLRLNFGAYNLDHEDEALLKKELVLIELRKVESLLSRLRDRVGEVDDRAECGAYEALLAYLTRRLQQIVIVIQPQR